MDPEQSALRFLPPAVPSQDHHGSPSTITGSSRELHDRGPGYGRQGEGTSSTRTSRAEDVPHRMNSRLSWNDEQDEHSTHRPCIDNNDNEGAMEREFISVEFRISNCQEESEIQLEDSSIDNNSNVPENNIYAEMSRLTRNLQPNDIMEEEEIISTF